MNSKLLGFIAFLFVINITAGSKLYILCFTFLLLLVLFHIPAFLAVGAFRSASVAFSCFFCFS